MRVANSASRGCTGAIEDHADMAWHLEQHPGMKAVVNLTPVLLDQLEDYVDQFARGTLRDPLLRLLARPENGPLGKAERDLVLEHCLGEDDENKARAFPAWERLREVFALIEPRGADSALSDQHYLDVLTWYHLGWTGKTARRASPAVRRLLDTGTGFSHGDRGDLFAVIRDLVRGILPRHATLAAAGRIELSTSPHHHPMAPLLMSFALRAKLIRPSRCRGRPNIREATIG